MARSGPRKMRSPFTGERNMTPCSETVRESAETEDLKTARIGEYGPRPVHEAMQTTVGRHYVHPRP